MSTALSPVSNSSDGPITTVARPTTVPPVSDQVASEKDEAATSPLGGKKLTTAAHTISVASGNNIVKFGSAENDIAAQVVADITECDRVNGGEDLFGSTEAKVREKFKPAYKVFRRASCDPSYCIELAKKLYDQADGNYAPSAKKPWCLAAFLALKPKTERHAKQTYESAYFFQHAAIEDISQSDFADWIEGRSLKASIALVRSRKKPATEPKLVRYPNIAKAKKLKKHAASAKILQDAWELAEEELKTLFEQEPLEA